MPVVKELCGLDNVKRNKNHNMVMQGIGVTLKLLSLRQKGETSGSNLFYSPLNFLSFESLFQTWSSTKIGGEVD
ncbi:hypothetical protein F0562_021868 [Nyssa sinensis]|uniref:Uncharacterized protein n=1 Tax=Nyssa sinensis TaxID=561372 RepID=A0A5J5BLE7_9ASTE|nr:hypothetical protein F0562_021868 [Nyssa sinensis]